MTRDRRCRDTEAPDVDTACGIHGVYPSASTCGHPAREKAAAVADVGDRGVEERLEISTSSRVVWDDTSQSNVAHAYGYTRVYAPVIIPH